MNGYKLLGYVIWRAGKWYLRRRLPSRRVMGAGFALLAGAAAAAVLARRASA